MPPSPGLTNATSRSTSTPDAEPRTRWLLLVGVWLVPGLIAAAQSWMAYTLRREMPQNWPYVAVQIPAWLSWALLTPLIFAIARRVPIQRERFGRALLVHFAAAIGVTIVHGLFWTFMNLSIQRVMEPNSLESMPLHSILLFSLLGRLVSGLVTYGAILGVASALDAQRRLRDREVVSARLAGELTAAQLRALKMQLHPHFLFNTLHAITVLIAEDPASARRMVLRLGDLLRLTLSRAASTEVSLANELELVRLYLDIEQTRFQDRLTVHYDIDPATLDARIPDLILQPLVENAIRHGVSPRAAQGRIEVRAMRDDGHLMLEVRDNGRGLSPDARTGEAEREGGVREGIGLTTTRSRLTHLYGGDHLFELRDAAGGGCVARIRIPFSDYTP